MKRKLNSKEMNEWVESVGGTKKAAQLVKEVLQCSMSKADKIVGCRYPSIPQPLEQLALAKLSDRSRDVLYPAVGRPRARAS